MKLSVNTLRRMLPCGALLCSVALQSGTAKAKQAAVAAGQNDVTAIDILLEPDATMIQHAQAANARLLENFPKGFA
jgi:hypothetical protein